MYVDKQEHAKKTGWEAEAEFRSLLDQQGIPYLPFCDNIDKFSVALGQYFSSKRPDIMILLRYVGFLLVDVKHKKHNRIGKKHFLFDAQEVEKYANFSEEFGQEVWYAVSNGSWNYQYWYWIPALQVRKTGESVSVNGGAVCYSVLLKNCIKIKSSQPFSQLFDQLFQSPK